MKCEWCHNVLKDGEGEENQSVYRGKWYHWDCLCELKDHYDDRDRDDNREEENEDKGDK